MGEAQWTPGPWRAIGHSGALGTGVLPSSGEMRTEGGPIIACWSACIGTAEAEANARLIAAAPDLYEALALMIADFGDYPASERPCLAFDKARAALAKANGETAA